MLSNPVAGLSHPVDGGPAVCKTCGNMRQVEIVLRLHRTLTGTRAVRRQGWYCWCCKTSHASAPDAALHTPAPARLAQRLRHAARRFGWPRERPDGHPDLAGQWHPSGRLAAS